MGLEIILRVLVTGANGFVGHKVVYDLLEKNYFVYAVTRKPNVVQHPNYINYVHEDLYNASIWKEVLRDIDVVIHLAARVHQMNDSSNNPWEEYEKVNIYLTKMISEAAVKNGVKHFIYMSSVKVNGEESNIAYNEKSIPNPVDDYGKSKYIAEQNLKEVSIKSSMKISIIRPPLVYGEGVKANFLSLVKLVDSSIPLPFKHMKNKRSMIYVGNLSDSVCHIIEHVKKEYNIYMVADENPISTEQLVLEISKALNRKSHLFPVPTSFFNLVGLITRKSMEVQRLVGSLHIETKLIQDELDWQPKYTMQEGLLKTLESYKRTRELSEEFEKIN